MKRSLKTTVGDKEVSTVLIGVNHADADNPRLYETMVFPGGGHHAVRTTTWDDAVEAHERVVASLKQETP
jgi:hypothetical protein